MHGAPFAAGWPADAGAPSGRSGSCIRHFRRYEARAVPSATEPAALPVLAWLAGLAFATLVMLALWVRQLRTRDATSVDAGWAAVIGLLACAYAALGSGSVVARVLAAVPTVLWSLRLSLHVVLDRVLRHRGEDGRYAALRQHLGPRAASRFVWVYAMQAALAAWFATPSLLLAHDDAERIRAIQVVGLALFVSGLGLETVSDRHLAAHRTDPSVKGRTCRRGPWRFSRHPNYFGEWLVWCGLGAIASPAPHGWLAWLAPASMFVLIRWVSGVPWSEQQSLRSRGDDYRAYQRETNCFFPWWPRTTASSRGAQ